VEVTAPDAGRPPAVLSLDTAGQVRTLCDTLDPPERAAARAPDAVQRSRILADREAKRAAALDVRYRVRTAPDRRAFAYDADARELSLSEHAWLWTAGGVLRVWPTEDAALPVPAEAAVAERIVKAAGQGKLTMTLTFGLPDDDEAACAHPAGARRWSLGVEPWSWEYAVDGEVLARGGEGRDRPLVTMAKGALPHVEVAEPVGAGASDDLRSAIAARTRDLERCYRRALAAVPDLDGSVVAEVDLGDGGGAPRAVRVAIDSVQDDGMTACVQGVLAATTFPRGAAALAMVPIHFDLLAP
jgi:hypothetical protein